MQKYDKDKGIIGVNDLDRWPIDSAAVGFLSATETAGSIKSLRNVSSLTRYRIALISSSSPSWRGSTAHAMIWSFWQEQLCFPVAWIAFPIPNLKDVNGPIYGADFLRHFVSLRHGRTATSLYNISHVSCSPPLVDHNSYAATLEQKSPRYDQDFAPAVIW